MGNASPAPSKRTPRWASWLLVGVGAGVVIAVVVSLVAFVKLGLGLKRPTEKPIALAGCDVAKFIDYAGDAGSGIQTTAPFGLWCEVSSTSPSAPTCGEVVAKYIAANGVLTKDVLVFVTRGRGAAMQRVCQQRYSGDGSPR